MNSGGFFFSAVLLLLGRAAAVGDSDVGVCKLLESGQEIESLGAVFPSEGKNAGKYYSASSGDGNIDNCTRYCCNKPTCHVAYLYGGETCYLISCYSRESCKPKPSDSSRYSDSKFVWVRYPDEQGQAVSDNPSVTNSETSAAIGTSSDTKLNEASREEGERNAKLNSSESEANPVPPRDDSPKSTADELPNLNYGENCGEEFEGLCSGDLVCRSGDDERKCLCRDGASWDESGKKCSVIADSPSPQPWKPQPCQTGLRQCGDNEICQVDKEREKSKRGMCRCMRGLERDESSGSCVRAGVSDQGSETEKPTTTRTQTPAQVPAQVPKKSRVTVKVLGEEEVTLPVPDVELKAVIHENVTDKWSYSWTIQEYPENRENPDKEASVYSPKWTGQTLRLEKLSPGKYSLKVDVTGIEYEGVGKFTLQVHPEPIPNSPPKAVIDPAAIQADEGTKIILDGSQSNDPDGSENIVKYKWALEKGPALEGFEPANSPTYQFNTGLPAGNYTFSLTVFDAAGLSDKTSVAVAVSKERDDPPKAVAGSCDTKAASGDFSVTLGADQKDNYFFVCGNRSQDDKGIVKYLWNRIGKTDLPADTAGSSTPVLKVTNIEPGSYEFSLKVEDAKEQTDEVTLTVHVAPSRNERPVAIAKLAEDKPLVLTRPDEKLSVVLDGTSSSDDGSITAFKWSQISGPTMPKIANSDKPQATASELIEGVYKFQLNVTDEQGASSSTQLTFNVTRSSNKPPVAKVSDVQLALPSTEAVLDGSTSTDDAGVVSYEWKLSDSSSALLTILGDSDKESKLRLGNLLPGKFNFTLTVTDAAGLQSSATATLDVTASKDQKESVEMYLEGRMADFTESATQRLRNSLSTLLRTRWPNAEAELSEIGMDHSSGRVRLVFHVVDEEEVEDGGEGKRQRTIVDAASVLDHIDRRRDMLQGFYLSTIDTLYCKKEACSEHGTCNDFTKECVCNRFWMPNLFAVFIMGRKNSCDWSVFYFLIVTLLALSTVSATLWAMFCVGRRWCRKPTRRRKYKLLDDSPNSNHRGIGFKKVKGRNGVQMSSLLVSDSAGSDTEEEVTLYDTGTLKRSASYSRTKASKA